MAFDFKREYKKLYLPQNKPELVDIPAMNFLAVRGSGNPNEEHGEYKAAIGLLYGVAFTIKMSPRAGKKIEGFFDYVVPPLEGLWWQDGVEGVDYAHKELFQWISLIRLPDFVTKEDFEWAVGEAERKKKTDFSKVELFHYQEGACVQCMHVGAYDEEPATIEKMEQFAQQNGFETDFSLSRFHHEIYLSDAKRCAAAKLKTVIRHPVRRKTE